MKTTLKDKEPVRDEVALLLTSMFPWLDPFVDIFSNDSGQGLHTNLFILAPSIGVSLTGNPGPQGTTRIISLAGGPRSPIRPGPAIAILPDASPNEIIGILSAWATDIKKQPWTKEPVFIPYMPKGIWRVKVPILLEPPRKQANGQLGYQEIELPPNDWVLLSPNHSSLRPVGQRNRWFPLGNPLTSAHDHIHSHLGVQMRQNPDEPVWTIAGNMGPNITPLPWE